MRLHDLPGDGQPEACVAGRAPGHLHELSKQARQILAGNAASRIADRDIDPIVRTPRGNDNAAAARRRADGIRHKVREHAFDLRRSAIT